MAHLNPILRDLKSDLALLKSSKITDNHPYIVSFCKSLELTFNHGLFNHEGHLHFFEIVEVLAKDENRNQGLNALVRHIVTEIR